MDFHTCNVKKYYCSYRYCLHNKLIKLIANNKKQKKQFNQITRSLPFEQIGCLLQETGLTLQHRRFLWKKKTTKQKNVVLI